MLAQADREFQYHLLHGVARTFALTIPQLSPDLADVVANAYLLCRIADTIEDESSLNPNQRQQLAAEFISVVNAEADANHFTQTFLPLLSAERLAAEKQLIATTPRVIAILRSFSARQQVILVRCVTIMLEGMVYYQSQASRAGLPDQMTFDNYCYHVAGVVGEMITELYCDHNPTMQAQREELLRLAISFGQGLQMINILKDIWEDYQRGVCWLPASIFNAVGCDLTQLGQYCGSAEFAAGLQKMIAINHVHLQNALLYIQHIPQQESGLRKFSLWALAMGVLTLRKIHNSPNFSTGQQVKIKKLSVYISIMLVKLLWRYNRLLSLAFRLLARNLPVTPAVSTNNQHQLIREWFHAGSY